MSEMIARLDDWGQPAWIAVMVPFHGLTLLTMNIFFWPNIVIIALFMTDSDRFLAPRLARWAPDPPEPAPPAAASVS